MANGWWFLGVAEKISAGCHLVTGTWSSVIGAGIPL